MNRSILELLKRAGWRRPAEVPIDETFVIVCNYGAIPPPAELPRGSTPGGFKLVLLDRNGCPTHFCRCGSVEDRQFSRERRILQVLGTDPALDGMVPSSRGASDGTLTVILTEFIHGRHFDVRKEGRSAPEWSAATRAVLDASYQVTSRAMAILPEFANAEKRVLLAEEAEGSIGFLLASGYSERALDDARQALSMASPLPRHAQHGDLWPGNVIRSQGSWWIIDYEEFGWVQVPMYDVLHMLQTSLVGHRDKRKRLGDASAWVESARCIVHEWAARFEIDDDQLEAATLFFLLRSCAHYLRPEAANTLRSRAKATLDWTFANLEAGTALRDSFPRYSSDGT